MHRIAERHYPVRWSKLDRRWLCFAFLIVFTCGVEWLWDYAGPVHAAGTPPTKIEPSNLPLIGGNTSIPTAALMTKCPRAAAAGDTMFLLGIYGTATNEYSSTADNQGGNTWVADNQAHDGTDGDTAFIVRANNLAAGTQRATVTLSSVENYSGISCLLMNNITTATPTDGTCSRGTSNVAGTGGSPVSCNSSTAIGASGDELIMCMFRTDVPGSVAGSALPTFTAGSGFTLFDVDNFGISACEYGNISAATNPAITYSANADWITVGVAYKTASAGGAPPTGIYAPFIENFNLNDWNTVWASSVTGTTVTFNLPCPAATTALDVFWGAGASNMISSVSSSPSLTWTGTTQASSTTIFAGHFYATGLSSACSSTMTITFTLVAALDTDPHTVSGSIWAIQNTAGLDSTNFPCNSTGNSTSTSFPVSIVNTSCATTVANELITEGQQEDFQSVTSSSLSTGTGSYYDLEPDIGLYQALGDYQDGGAATVYASSAGGYAVTWVYSKYDTGQTDIGHYAAQALAWKPSASPHICTLATTGAGPC